VSVAGDVVSVLYAADYGAFWLDWEGDWTCAECGSEVRPPAVYWHGEKLMLFHPECAARLGPHLIADAREATLAGDPGSNWRRRAIATVRHRMRLGEIVA
jgi:hypothetical protein